MLLFLFVAACNKNSQQNKESEQQAENPVKSRQTIWPAERKDLSGEQLAKMYCSTCHQFPEPGMLTKETWQIGVMPAMGPRMGIYTVDGKPYPLDPEKEKYGLYPEKAAMSENDWKKLLDYYFDNAPEKPLPQAGKSSPRELKGLFTAAADVLKPGGDPLICMVKIDPMNKRFFIGNMGTQSVAVIGSNLSVQAEIKVESAPSSMQLGGADHNNLLMSCMGTLYPSNEAKGAIIRYTMQGTQKLLTALQRPVKVMEEDLDADGLEDLLVCSYGHITGKLAWYKKLNNGSYQEKELKKIPGAIQVWTYDMNSDGLKDIVALFAQNEEQVVIFYNQGNGLFTEKQVLVFPSVYGSSYMELADFNKDGQMDLLVTNGDNADVSIQPKYFHGIRIYTNMGNDKFKETYFYPMYGAFKAMARDYDNDGDLDIAAISFFPDWDHNPENFVYLKNNGKQQFSNYYIPEAREGLWLSMDAGDVDGDGDTDLVLGNFVSGPMPPPAALRETWKEKSRMFLMLLNNGK